MSTKRYTPPHDWPQHWPEYLIELWGLGTFMIAACLFAALIEHPGSPVREAVPSAFARRVLMGLAMGLTAVSIIYSPWGRRSGAHLNPAVTLTFYRLGKLSGIDAGFYVASQFAGGLAGVALAAWLLPPVGHPAVQYVVTVPGVAGPLVALVAEAVISGGLMLGVLVTANHPRLARFTGWLAGFLLLVYISIEAPLSGMSINPARTLGSAAVADIWTGLWIYFAAPVSGMLIAAEVYVRREGTRAVLCAKLSHNREGRCIFRCRFDELRWRSDARHRGPKGG